MNIDGYKFMEGYLQKFRAIFLDETSALLNQTEKDILELEQLPDKMVLIEPLFRAMHTLKGSSAMYGYITISELAHGLESLFQSIRENKISFKNSIIDITLMSIDLIRELIIDEFIKNPENVTRLNILNQKIEEELETVCKFPEKNKSINEYQHTKSATWQIIIHLNENQYFRGINIPIILNDLSSIGHFEINRIDNENQPSYDIWNIILYTNSSEEDIRNVFIFIEDDCQFIRLSDQNLFNENTVDNQIKELTIAELAKNDKIHDRSLFTRECGNKQKLTKEDNTTELIRNTAKRISVDSSKLDFMMFLVSELITLNSQFNLSVTDESYDKIRPLFEHLDGLSKQFRKNAFDMRLVPLSESVFRFQRLVRDLSIQLKKEVELVTEGIEIEVDKGTLDELNEPMMHIIRNCIDHGIENPELRIKKGKKEKGQIKISGINSGNRIIIKIEDDGNGIDLQKIKQKAIDKGVLKQNDTPSRQELLEMIFLPGFSTAQSLTQISGRGVGMDIVKNKINELKGEIIIETIDGKGTSFIFTLPQSITIIDSLLFKLEDTFFTLPVLDIDACIQVSYEEIKKSQSKKILNHNGLLIPYVDLRSILKINGFYDETVKVIIINTKGKKIAVLTDAIIGNHQAVMKPIGKFFRNQKIIGAASQLGDGNLAFMLESKELITINQ